MSDTRPGASPAPLWAVVPAKGGGQAKSRLSSVLPPEARQQLASDMLRHVLKVLADTPGVHGRLVVTNCADTADLAASMGAEVMADPVDDTRSSASTRPAQPRLARVVDAGLARIAELGAAFGLVVMADLPTLSTRETERAIATVQRGEVALAGDRQGLGTSALGLPLEHARPTQFGHPDSLARHRTAWADGQPAIEELDCPGLRLDVDTAQDLSELIQRSDGWRPAGYDAD